MTQRPNYPPEPPPAGGSSEDLPPAPPVEASEYAGWAASSTEPGPRPGTVIAGCVLAWIGAAVGVMAGAFALAISASSDLLDEIAKEADRQDAARLMHVSGGVTLLWCVLVAVFAFFAFRRASWAAVALVVMAVVVGLLSVVNLTVTGTPQATPALVWSAVSAGLIYGSARARAWFKAGDRRGRR